MICGNMRNSAPKVSGLIWNNVDAVGQCCSGKINRSCCGQQRVSNGKRQSFPQQTAGKFIEGKTKAQKFGYLKCI